MSLTCVTDLRGKGRWLPADYERKADLWIIADTWQERPNVTGRVLAYINPAVLYIDGKLAGEPGSFARTLDGLPLLPLKPLWKSDDGRQSLLALDITKRGVVGRIIAGVRSALSWAAGVNVCYFTALDFVEPGRYPVEFWGQWDNNLTALANGLRGIAPGFACVVQQFHLTTPTMNGSGLYLEGNGPYDFRYTPEKHASDKRAFDIMTARVDGRESVWVQEVRFPETYTAASLKAVLDWAHTNGMYTSVGRDATAKGAQ